ncbi:uncharacterized protein TNCV_2112501 [Trichonephila clavipes]|nr:uncharacterized protein TNCV_2112501 [Trichonephila clavipes]
MKIYKSKYRCKFVDINLQAEVKISTSNVLINKNCVVVAVSFPKGRNESFHSLIHVALLYDRGRHHLSQPPQFKHGTGEEENILQPSVPVVSAATTHKIFPTDLTSTYSLCTRREFGGIGHRTQALRSGV